jgi:hypothetical protein
MSRVPKTMTAMLRRGWRRTKFCDPGNRHDPKTQSSALRQPRSIIQKNRDFRTAFGLVILFPKPLEPVSQLRAIYTLLPISYAWSMAGLPRISPIPQAPVP